MRFLISRRLLTGFSIAIALLTLTFFAARVSRYISRPTFGFTTYYSSALVLTYGEPAKVLYDDGRFRELRHQLTGIDSKEPFAPNPPLISVLFIPFSYVQLSTAKILWECLSFFLLIALFLAVRRDLNLDASESSVVIALCLGFTPLYLNFVYGQFYVFALFLLACAFRYWQSRKRYLFSVVLAFLLLLKGLGVFFLLLAFLARDWAIFMSTLVFYLIAAAVSAVFLGTDAWVGYFLSVLEHFPGLPSPPFQQNIPGFVSYLMGLVSSGPLFALIGYLLAGGLGIGVLYWFTKQQTGARSQIPFMAALILGLLFSPIIGDYHFLLLLIPIVFLYSSFRQQISGVDLAIFAASIFLVSANISFVPSSMYSAVGLFAFPRVYGSVLLLYLLYRKTVEQSPATEIIPPVAFHLKSP